MRRLLPIIGMSLLFLSGCMYFEQIQTSVWPPLYRPQPYRMPPKVTDAITARAILIGLHQSDGWEVLSNKHNTIIAGLYVRTHSAVVSISYGNGLVRYSLMETQNLNEEDGKIHPKFNQWYRTLESNIRVELDKARYK